MLQIMEADNLGLGDRTGAENPSQDSPQAPDTDSAPEAPEAPEMPEAPQMGSGSQEPKNYMFFSNLEVIKEKVEKMLAMDVAQVDAMLSDGHDWANDHISTSKDDVEEVCNWLCSKIGRSGPPAPMGGDAGAGPV